MKIRIKQFRGVPVVNGFFPVSGMRMKPKDILECSEAKATELMATDLVEVVVEGAPTLRLEDEDKFACDECDGEFKSEAGLKSHKTRVHDAQTQSGS